MSQQQTVSNPRPCPHSMVTDLCGLCIRDTRITELEQRCEGLLHVLLSIKEFGHGVGCGRGYTCASMAASAIEHYK